MNVSFARNDPLNSDVVDGATGRVLFEVSTPWKLGTSTTTIRDARRDVIAQYERRWGHDRVTYHGETRRVADWLPKKGFLSRCVVALSQSSSASSWSERPRWSSARTVQY
ncbi:hypothetical protein C8Q80DRAFT_1147926 [Daedaleopsis nitida]|nr:hypothetical protein C8Q80DRAFT_1147926 [Daedaleopsis nitida]